VRAGCAGLGSEYQSRPDRFRRSNSNDDDSLPHRGPSRRSGSADDDRGSSSGRPASSRRRVNHDDRPDSRHGSSSANYSSNNASSNNNSSSQIRPSGVRMTAAQRRLAMAEKARSNGVPSSSSASSLQKRNVSPPRMASSVNTSLQRLERAGRENAYTESEAETFLQRAQGSLDMASRATGNFLARVRGRGNDEQAFCHSSHHSCVRYSTLKLISTVLSYLTILLFKRYLF